MLKLLKKFRAKDWLYMLVILLFVVLSVFLTLQLPENMTKVTTLVETQGALSEIWKAGAVMLACALGDACCAVIVGFLTSQVSASFSMRLRRDIYNKVVSFSLEEIGKFSTASLVTRSTNDVTQIQMLISMGLQALLRAPIIAVWSIFKILDKGSQWISVTAGAVVILLILIGSNIIVVLPKFKLVQKLTDNMNRVMRENLTGVRVVRAYNAEQYQEVKFDGVNKEVTDTHLFIGKIMAYLFPGMQFVMSGTSLSIYWLGAFIINAAAVQDRITIFSNMVVFMAYAIQVIMAFMMLSMIFMLLPRAQVSAERINQVLDTESKIHDGEFRGESPETGTIEFRDVSFRYPDAAEPVLEHITFRAEHGQTVAFIGSTGSGKSTLVNLVPRFYDATSGEILVDGVNVRDYTLKDLHEKIGYVSQKAVLFRGTIASNVDYGTVKEKHLGEERILQSLEIAQGSDIVTKEEKGIHAEVAQGGSNFSGGQKQRISIARAICGDPEIYIFDDSFSALDYKTDKKLRARLKEETKGATILIVAQRIGTVRDADQIIVLNEGQIVGIGTHEELLAGCEVYQQIALSQLSKEELAHA